MGYELTRLMKQYGVASPTMASAPQMPGSPPVAPTIADNATTAQRTQYEKDLETYNKDKAAFDESVRKYGLAQKEYDQYKSAYQDRLANTNMYNQAQFSTTGASVPAINTLSDMQKRAMGYGTPPTVAPAPADYLNSDAYKKFQKDQEGAVGTMDMYESPYFGMFTSGSIGRAQDAAYEEWLKANPTQVVPASKSGFGIGQEAANKNIRDWMAANPNVSPAEFADIKQRYGVNDYDIRNAMGTGTQYGTPQWTDTVNAPIYDTAPISLAGKSPQEIANWYLGRRDIGYTDADLRAAGEKTFGKLPESAWRDMLSAAYPQYVNPVNSAYAQLGRSGFGTNINQIDDSGYNYWLNQLSSGAVNPEGLNAAVYKAGVDWNPAQGDAYDLSNVPQNFDWTYYVNNNPDLPGAGIDTLPEAQMHYAAYGMNEGRSPYEGYVKPMPDIGTGSPNPQYDSLSKMTLDGKPISSSIVAGNPLFKTILGSYGDGYLGQYRKGGQVRAYAEGGAVKGYQDGGLEDRGIVDPETGAIVYPVPEQPEITSRPIYNDPVLEGAARAIDRARTNDANIPAPAVAGTRSVAAAAPPLDARAAALQSMLDRYGPRDVDYGSQITEARTRAADEQRAFEQMLRAQLESPEDAASSKAEMYFRLAAAFGSPTKTGHFTENLSLAGKEMAETAKSQRESRAKKLGIRMELQKMKMDAANKELDTLRALEQEGARDRRAIAQEMIREYIASGKPQSTAGKTAVDMGFTPGTPEFNAKVEELAALEIQRQTALINAQLASAAATTQRAGQMSPTEINLRTETENNIANIDQAIRDVAEAYRLNPNSYAGGWLDRGQRWLYEVAGSDDPRIVNTRRIDNLLGAQALSSLRAIFGGNPTEGERAILLELQGIGSRSLEERRQIMLRLAEVLEDRKASAQTRLDRILSGAYRTYTPLEGEQ